MIQQANQVEQAIKARKSVRGFLPKAVELEIIEDILSVAAFAPSGSNTQPWKVHVVTGEARDRLATTLVNAHNSKAPQNREYDYYPAEWRSPYTERRRAAGWGLYSLLGIEKGDRDASFRQHARNFEFFDAPTVLIFTIDNDMGKGSWLDYGMFLQNIMIAAVAHGLATCPQAALANFPQLIRDELNIPLSETVICGIAIGYEDPDNPANAFRTSRVTQKEFTTVHD